MLKSWRTTGCDSRLCTDTWQHVGTVLIMCTREPRNVEEMWNVYAKEWRGLGSFGYFEEQWLKWIKELKYLVFLPSSFLFYFCLVSFIFVVVFEYVKCVNLILPKPPPPLSSSECVKALLKVGQKVYSIPCFCYFFFFTLKVLGPSCTLLIRQLKKVIKLKEQQAKLKESIRKLSS